jgi:hypothetical protein
MNLRGLELKRDMEFVLTSGNVAKASADPRNLAPLLSWIKSNTVKGSGGADPAAADGTGTRTDGTQVAFVEPNLKVVLNSIWTNGGKPDVIMTGAFNKHYLSGAGTPAE